MQGALTRLFLLLPLLAGVVMAEENDSPPPVDPKVILKVSLDTSQREFHIGEIIPLKLFFSSRVKNRYRLDEASYDRSGRMNFEHFQVVPASGAVDPIPAEAFNLMGGGMTNFRFLKPKPWSMRLNLNEWVRFDVPGEYKLTISSTRVEVRDPTGPYVTKAVTARSNEITLKILAADRDWQKRTFAQAVATIDAHTPNPNEIRIDSDPPTPVEIAWDTLRYLGTQEAAGELAKRLREGGFNNEEFVCYMGLVSSPERVAARDALREALADPDHPIDGTFLSALRIVESEHHPANPFDKKEQRENDQERKIIEDVIAVLPNKRGQALPITLHAVARQAWAVKTLPPEIANKVAQLVVEHFDQFPVSEQCDLLRTNWDKFGGPALLPLVRHLAQFPRDPESEGAPGQHFWDPHHLQADAIRRWFELDPVGARPFIIKEITRQRPRLSVSVLGILPDKTLPEVDGPLVENLTTIDRDSDFNSCRNRTALVARYATPAILPRVLKVLDAHIGKWNCEIEGPLFAYVLRAGPPAARSRIERALTIHGRETDRYCNLLPEIAAIHYDPVLEEIGIRALDERKWRVESPAAEMLGKFGSPAAEAALLRRYEKWSRHWAGRESKLMVLYEDGAGALSSERSFGETLAEALAEGQGWLYNPAKLRKLRELNKVHTIQTEIDRYLKTWDKQPLTIDLWNDDFSVAQHHFIKSMDVLEKKLAQFPAGTEFAVSRLEDSKASRENLARLRAFLSSHGMSIKEETVEND